MIVNKLAVEELSVSSSQLKELFSQIDDGSIVNSQLQAFLEHRNPFFSMDISNQLLRWQEIFDEINISCDVSKVFVPEKQTGFERLIVVPKGLLMNKMVEIMRGKFEVWTCIDDLDENLVKNSRSNKECAYAIWVQDRVKVEKKAKKTNINITKTSEEEVAGITLLEWFLYELMYFLETGRSLDIKSLTLCSGSLYSDGNIPSVYWSPSCNKVNVIWYNPNNINENIYTRAVIS